MKKIIIGCTATFIVVVFIMALGAWLFLFRELPMLEASLTLSSEAALNTTIPLVITATNPHSKPVTLDSIDFEDIFLEGFQVVQITPEAADTLHIFGYRCWIFSQQVEPGESVTVTFLLKAVQLGHYSGDIDVCNPNGDCKTLLADVMVKE